MTLNLTLKKQWFDMIRSGKKTEEYREVKEYWIKRLVKDADYPTKEGVFDFIDGYGQEYCITEYQPFTHIKFTNGYSLTSPSFTIECKGIRIGRGNPEWGAPTDKDVFIISLGKIIES